MGLWKLQRWLYSPAAKPAVCGVQLALAQGACFAVFSADVVKRKLGAVGGNLVLALILLANVLPVSTGGSTLLSVLLLILAAVGTGLSAVPIYAAYAANGGSYVGDGAAKTATLVAVSSVMCGLFTIARFRFGPLPSVSFFLLTFLFGSYVFGTYWFPTAAGVVAIPKTPLQLAPAALIVATAVPCAIALLITWLLLPLPAGRQARTVFCAVLRDLAALGDSVVELATAEAEDGAAEEKDAAAGNKAGGESESSAAGGRALLLTEAFATNDRLRKGLSGLQGLIKQTKFERDLWARQMAFPAKAYTHAAADIGAATVSLTILLRQLSIGIAPAGLCGLEIPEPTPPDLSLCRAAASALAAAQAALRGCLGALAAVVEEDLPLPDALRQLSALEAAWRGVWDAMVAAEGGQAAVLALRVAVGLLFSAAAKVRAAFGHVASGVEALQPGAEAAVVAHLEASAWDAYFPGLVAKLPLPPGEAAPLVAVGGPEPTAFKDVGGEPGEGPWSEPPLAFSVLRRGLAAAGLGRAQLAPGLQSCITLATAFLLVVVKSAYLALGSKSYWVIYTVCAVTDGTVGRVFLKARNRLVGSIMGAAWGYACIAVAYAANGASYANTSTKYAVIAVMVSAWGGFTCWGRLRSGPKTDYLWAVALLTNVVVVVEALYDPNPPWTAAAWRLASVCIGMGVDLTVSMVVFPVTSAVLMRQELGTTCAILADLAEGTAADTLCGAGGGSGGGLDEHADVEAGGDGGPAAPLWSEAESAASWTRLAALGAAVQASLVAMKDLRDSEAREQRWSGGVFSLITGRSSAQLEGADAAMSVAMRLRDSLLAVGFYGEVLPWVRTLAASLPPARRRLVLAAGARMAACLRALPRALRGELPMAAALRTLAPLDAVLGQLMAAQSAEVWPGRQRGDGRWAAVGPSTPGSDVNSVLTTFIAAALGSSAGIRKLYYAAAVSLLLSDQAAIAATGAEVQRWRGGLLEAQQAAISAALMEEACRVGAGSR